MDPEGHVTVPPQNWHVATTHAQISCRFTRVYFQPFFFLGDESAAAVLLCVLFEPQLQTFFLCEHDSVFLGLSDLSGGGVFFGSFLFGGDM